jgi:hypothetical protein
MGTKILDRILLDSFTEITVAEVLEKIRKIRKGVELCTL